MKKPLFLHSIRRLFALSLSARSAALLVAQTPENPPAAVKVDPGSRDPETWDDYEFRADRREGRAKCRDHRHFQNVKNQLRASPLLNDPYFRRFFGLPEEDEDGVMALPRRSRRRGEAGAAEMRRARSRWVSVRA